VEVREKLDGALILEHKGLKLRFKEVSPAQKRVLNLVAKNKTPNKEKQEKKSSTPSPSHPLETICSYNLTIDISTLPKADISTFTGQIEKSFLTML